MSVFSSNFIVLAVIATLLGVLLSYYHNPLTQTIHEAAFNNDIDNMLKVAVKHSYAADDADLYIDTLTRENVPKRAIELLCQERDKYGNTALHWAAKSAALDVAHYLVNLPCFDVNILNNAGSTALHWAATAPGPSETFMKPYRDAVDGEQHSTIDADGTVFNFDMERAAVVDDTPRPINVLIPLLLSRGINVNTVNKGGETPLHWAVEWQSLWSVRALLYANASVTALDQHQNQPLHKIDAECHKKEVCTHIVSLMVAAEAPTMVANEYGRTVLEHFDTTAAVPTLTTGELYFITEAKRLGNILPRLDNLVKEAREVDGSPTAKPMDTDTVLMPPTRIAAPRRIQQSKVTVGSSSSAQRTEGSDRIQAPVNQEVDTVQPKSSQNDEINE